MVIQRWQSLLLLVSVVLVAVFCFTPYAIRTATEAPVFVKDAPVFLIINMLVSVLLFISIFLYKNLKLQMRVTLAGIVLLAASMLTCAFILWRAEPDADLLWCGGVLLLPAATVCAVAALRFMKKDLRLLRSYDRLL